MLADTIGEMALGFTEKADQKAIKKILFLLSRAGYQPTKHEDEPVVKAAKAPAEWAFLRSPDAAGCSLVTYGKEGKDRLRWLHVSLNEDKGILDAFDDDVSHSDLEKYLAGLEANPKVAPIETGYGLNRVARALARSSGYLPPVIAYWRSMLPPVEGWVHPADSLHRRKFSSEDHGYIPMTIEEAFPWRLELGSVAGIFAEMHDEYSRAETEGKSDRFEAMKEQSRGALFTPDIIADQATRLLDLAYVRHDKRRDDAHLLLSAADELRTEGAASGYARGLFDKSLLMLAEIYRRSSEDSDGGPR